MSKMRYWVMSLALAVISGCGGGGGGTGATGGSPSALAATTTHGTITGFGSVVINGRHYDTSNASFEVDDASGSQSDLSAGEVVTISGTSDGQGNHQAHAVEYDSTLVGPISAINSAGNTFTALGQTVRVDVTTIYSGVANLAALSLGDNVAVSGTRDASGDVLATFVRKLAAVPASVRLSGPIAALNGSTSTFTIGAETINYAGALIEPTGAGLQNGLPVVVSGALDSTGSTINAAKVRVHKDLGSAGSGDHAELEGIITQSAQNGSFQVGTMVVDYDANTQFNGGSASDLVAGNKVEVHGTLNADGSLQAAKIEVEVASHAGDSQGFLIGALSAAPDTTSTPNTISLLGVTVSVPSSALLSDHEQNDQMFKLSDLKAGDRVAVAVQLTPAGTAGAAPTLTALKIERPDPQMTASGASGAFSNTNAAAMTLTVETVSVTGQTDCPVTAGSSGSSSSSSSSSSSGAASSSSSSSSSGGSSSSSGGSSGSGSSSSSSGGSGGGNATCTQYFVQGQPVAAAAFFQALGVAANANSVVLALGTYANGTLTAQGLDLRTGNESGDENPQPH